MIQTITNEEKMGSHNSALPRVPSVAAPDTVRNGLRDALVGTRPIKRSTAGGKVVHRIRYQRSHPIDLIIIAIIERLDQDATIAEVMEFPEMLSTWVLSLALQRRPLELAHLQALSIDEQCAQGTLDIEQLHLHERPTKSAIESFLQAAAQYRAKLTLMEAACHRQLAAGGSRCST